MYDFEDETFALVENRDHSLVVIIALGDDETVFLQITLKQRL